VARVSIEPYIGVALGLGALAITVKAASEISRQASQQYIRPVARQQRGIIPW